MAGDDMTALEAWRQMAMAENIRAQRNWQGLENDKPVSLREITVVTKATPEEPPEKPHSSKALWQRIQRLHLDGLAPDEITAQLACPEAVVWKGLRGLYIVGGKSLSNDYRQLRVARVYALKQQGLAVSKIANLLGFTTALLNMDLREVSQEWAQRNSQGLENDTPVTLPAKPEEPPRTKALRQRIQRLHLDGLAPDEITAQLACPEAVVWKDLRGLYNAGGHRLSDDYRQLRVARVYALKQQGLAVSKIAVLLGFTSVLLNKDLREMPQDQARAAAVVVQEGENTGRTQNG